MPWFIVSYDIAPNTTEADEALDGEALRWGWDKYKKVGGKFKRLPERTLIGEFQDFSAAASNFSEIRNRTISSNQIKLLNIILIETKDYSFLISLE